MKRIKIKRKYKYILVLLFLVVLAIFMMDASLCVKTYTIHSEKVTENIKIAFAADLHSCNYGQGQEILLNALQKENPDILLLGGDIVDDKISQKKSIEFLEAVSKKYPTYYVSGNHEYWTNKIDKIKNMIRGYGITVLEGDCIPLTIKNQKINLCGVNDPEVGESIFYNQLNACASKVDHSNYSILLSHRPEYINDYLNYHYDLILSGHSHGGQWRLPLFINGLYSPNQGWFPKYAGGEYHFDKTEFIVSRGLAKESTRYPRIFNRPELVMIEIGP